MTLRLRLTKTPQNHSHVIFSKYRVIFIVPLSRPLSGRYKTIPEEIPRQVIAKEIVRC